MPCRLICEVATSGFFGKSVMSNDVFLGHGGERILHYSRHMKGLPMKKYKYDPTDRGEKALVCFALPHSSSL